MKLPEEFIKEIESYGAEYLSTLAETLASTEPEVSIRLNPAKGASMARPAEKVAWCDNGFYLDSRPQFTFDPGLHQGLYYVQDASSMAICAAIKRIAAATGNRPLRYLDACAAPGGKTTAAIDTLPAGSMVTANEYDYRRAAILAENIAKWGSPSVVVSRGDTSRLSQLTSWFDVVAADVPCSGEGMMRKDREAAEQWSRRLVAECVERQREIVGNLWEALRPGGYMIYSTCTFNRHENEEMVDYICGSLGGETVDVGLDSYEGVAGGLDTPHWCYRFIPGRVRGEGLFMSVIRKHGEQEQANVKASKKPVTVLSKATPECSNILDSLEGEFEPVMIGDRLLALPKDKAELMKTAASRLDVLSAGICTATVKGRDIIPSQESALSTALRREAYPEFEADYQTALAYLRREAISIDAPKGYVLLTYSGRPLGFVKNLGNRANNLYPAPWRILSQNVPSEAPETVI